MRERIQPVIQRWKRARRIWAVGAAAVIVIALLLCVLLSSLRGNNDWASLVPGSSPLAEWLQEQAGPPYAGHPASAQRRQALAEALKKTHLSAQQLVQVAKVYQAKANDDLGTAVIDAAAVDQAGYELPIAGAHTAAARPILAALADTKHVFWRAVQQNQPQYYEVMARLNRFLIRYVSPGDPDLDLIRQQAQVGLVESLMCCQHVDEAIKVAENTDTSKLPPQVRTNAIFAHAMALMRANRFDEAVPLLQSAAKDRGFKDAKSVQIYLFMALANANRPQEARAVLDQFDQRYHDRQQSRYMALMLSSQSVKQQAISDAD